MKKLTKIISIVLTLVMCLTLCPQAVFADTDPSHIAADGGTTETPVVLNVTPANFSVTVPTGLPITMTADGQIETADSAKIINHSAGAVKVANVAVEGQNDWVLVDFGTDPDSFKVDEKKVGLQVNTMAEITANDGSFSFDATKWAVMTATDGADGGDDECVFTYDAILAPQSAAITDAVIANVVFTIDWDKVDIVDAPAYDVDDSKANAYALVLDNSAASSNKVPMIFVREDQAPSVGNTYESEVFGSLPVTAVFSSTSSAGFENDTYLYKYTPWASYASQVTSVTIEDTVSPNSTAHWFADFKKCNSFDLIKLDTSSVESMRMMFAYAGSSGYYGSFNMDVSHFDTSKVTSMWRMFYCAGQYAQSWSIGDLSNWNVSQVTTMNSMFCSVACYASTLSLGDLSYWNTQNVTDMSNMFNHFGYTSTTNGYIGDISGWDTAKVTTVSRMFDGCYWLTEIDISNWNTVSDFAGMFSGCCNLTTINASGIITGQAEQKISSMFSNCQSLSDLAIDGWDTSMVTSLSNIFSECDSLTEIDLSGWNTANVTDMSAMFAGSNNIKTIYASELWNRSNVTNGADMFTNCNSLPGYNSTKNDITYANYEDGYLTYKAAPTA